MSLNPDIKKLCDKSLENLFSLEDWKKIKNKKNKYFLLFINFT